MKYLIKTFGCQQNIADSERLAGYYENRGLIKARGYADADLVVINTCVVRQKAEDKIYGLVRNLRTYKNKNKKFKIVVTGCLVGTAVRDPSGKTLCLLKKRLPAVDEFLPIEEVGFDYQPVRHYRQHAWVPISNGCNNFCTFCIVPYSRGREISRPYQDIIKEVTNLISSGPTHITLLGQNVNSYGSDLVKNSTAYRLPNQRIVKPVMVKHLGRPRIPTLFPYLLQDVASLKGVTGISFISANPWDFSAELIRVIKENAGIDRTIHLPVQSGSDTILKLMNRWYTKKEYLALINKIRRQIPEAQFTTDLIVGFPGETKEAFQDTLALAKQVGFVKAFVACYSSRPGTTAAQRFKDEVPAPEKKRRFHLLDQLINHQRSPSLPRWLRPGG